MEKILKLEVINCVARITGLYAHTHNLVSLLNLTGSKLLVKKYISYYQYFIKIHVGIGSC